MIDPAILALFHHYNSLISAAWQYDGQVDCQSGKMLTKSRDLFAKADAAKAAFLDALSGELAASISPTSSRLQEAVDEMKGYHPNLHYFGMITVRPDKFMEWIKSIEEVRRATVADSALMDGPK